MDGNGLPVRYFQGRQANSHILHAGDGFYYNVREVRGNRVRLRCRLHFRRGLRCPGTASMDLATLRLHHNAVHTHEPDHHLQEELQIRRSMIEDARTDIAGSKIRSIILRHTNRCQNAELACRFTRVRMNSSLYKAKSSSYPSIPKTLLHLGVLLGQPNIRRLCTTVDGQDFIYQGVVGCQERRTVAVIFVSGRMIGFLSSLENIHADGTFKKRARKPKMAQIFNITTKFGTNVVGVVRVLMMSRTQEAYTEVLQYLKNLAPNLNPRRIHCDFERAQMNAFRIVYPTARVVGCLWHFGVAFSSYARGLGMAALANNNDEVFSFIRCLAGAPLLPHAMIWEGVLGIWDEIVGAGLGNVFLPLLQYFETEWKPRLAELSVFGMPERTNNCSESDNKSLSNVLPENGPNVFRLIGGFVQLEYTAHCDVLAIRRGSAVTDARRYHAILNDDRVRRLSTLLVAGQLTPSQFLHGASYAIRAAVNHGLRLARHEASDEDSDELSSEHVSDEDSDSD